MNRSVPDSTVLRTARPEYGRERARVEDAARRLQRWAAGHPEINAGRIWSTCLCLAEPAPELTADDLVVGARIILWIFAFDDLVDEGDLTHEEVETLAERYGLIARGHRRAEGTDRLGTLLREVCDGLTRYPVFDSVGGRWGRALSDTLHAMSQEHLWRRQYLDHGIQPSYAAYVENGLKSIAGAPYIWLALIMLGEPSTARHAGHLSGQMRQAAVCVRLANDLRSYLKELAEGNVNSVTLHTAAGVRGGRAPQDALEAARRQVEQEIVNGLALCARNGQDVRTDSGRPERVIRDIARWNCEFYSRHGYLTCRPETVAEEEGWTSARS
jgi:hypothetical protein